MPPPGTYKTERLNFQEILNIAILFAQSLQLPGRGMPRPYGGVAVNCPANWNLTKDTIAPPDVCIPVFESGEI